MPHEQMAQQLFEAQALLHDGSLDITETNRKRRMKATKRKEKKEKKETKEKKAEKEKKEKKVE